MTIHYYFVDFLESFYMKYGSFIPLSETDVVEHLKKHGNSDHSKWYVYHFIYIICMYILYICVCIHLFVNLCILMCILLFFVVNEAFWLSQIYQIFSITI